MKKMIMVMALIVAVVFIAGSVFAWGGCASQGKYGKEYQDKRDVREDMKKELGLTAEQDIKLKASRESHRTEVKALHDAIKVKKGELKAAIAKPGATRAQVEPIANELKALEVQMTDRRVDGIFAVKAILTPEQFAKLETMKAKHMKEWSGKNAGNSHKKD